MPLPDTGIDPRLMALYICLGVFAVGIGIGLSSITTMPHTSAEKTINVLIVFKNSTQDQIDGRKSIIGLGANITREFDGFNNIVAAEIPASIFDDIKNSPYVENMGLDENITATSLDTDTQIHAQAPWNFGFTGNGIKIAILDTGIDEANPEFAGKISDCISKVPNESDCQDLNGHGTHVAGIATAKGIPDTTDALTGVGHRASLIVVKVLDHTKHGRVSDAIAGIIYARQHDAKIISMSFATPLKSGNPNCDSGSSWIADVTIVSLKAVIDDAVGNNIVVVAAAGNDGSSSKLGAPACLGNVIAVGAVDNTDTLWPDSNKGLAMKNHGVVAPGVNVLSTFPNVAGEEHMTGTSQATPAVSGIIALMLQKDPSLTPSEIKYNLFKSACKNPPACSPLNDPPNQQTGFGRVDASAAVSIAPEFPLAAVVLIIAITMMIIVGKKINTKMHI